ncbi:NlpC/P60 family protein [Cohnella sp. CFH 77786]|uniref:C40 family peptidase n=1 Tax=Cohnella sp. CFH 77786 TaxID=2662265 RepID=UPI001C60E6FC|nr:C40 family peptidase [Cohnella sp. CFH 77786]MBW5447528.1 NlpC/P60 family protein [Cohnella sp. CFH 77786]
MKFPKLANKLFLASVLGLSLLAAQLFGAGAGSAFAAADGTVSTSAYSTASSKADKIVNFAKSLQGKVHYVFGVNDPSTYTFDCSSFTKYVFASQGINLKWSSRAQSRQGEYVAESDLQPGDLVFFSVSVKGQVNHVGIYIGDGKFIHNTIGKNINGIRIGDLSKYSSRYITARRVL